MVYKELPCGHRKDAQGRKVSAWSLGISKDVFQRIKSSLLKGTVVLGQKSLKNKQNNNKKKQYRKYKIQRESLACWEDHMKLQYHLNIKYQVIKNHMHHTYCRQCDYMEEHEVGCYCKLSFAERP